MTNSKGQEMETTKVYKVNYKLPNGNKLTKYIAANTLEVALRKLDEIRKEKVVEGAYLYLDNVAM